MHAGYTYDHWFRRSKLAAFFCLCLSMDFIGLVFIITFILYQPSEHAPYFVTIRNIYMWEGIICVLPLAAIACITGVGRGITIWILDMCDFCTFAEKACGICCIPLCFIIFGIPACIIFTCLATFVLIIISTLWTLYPLMNYGIDRRLPGERDIARSFYENVIAWILTENNEQKISIKLSVANQTILRKYPENPDAYSWTYKIPWENHMDKNFVQYLEDAEVTSFKDVTLKDIRSKCKRDYGFLNSKEPNPVREFMQDYCAEIPDVLFDGLKCNYYSKCYRLWHGLGIIGYGAVLFVLGPIYFLSRVFNMMMPFIIVVYSYIAGDAILFVDVDIFPVIIWSVYSLFVIIWFVSLGILLREEYYLCHLLPSTEQLIATTSWREFDALESSTRINEQTETLNRIKSRYFQIVSYPLMVEMLIDKFGSDIALVVTDYFDNIKMAESEIFIEELLCTRFDVDIARIVLNYLRR